MSEAQRALELDPFSLAVRTMMGWVLFSQRRYDDALDVWQGVLELEPEYGLAIYNLGLAYWMKRCVPPCGFPDTPTIVPRARADNADGPTRPRWPRATSTRAAQRHGGASAALVEEATVREPTFLLPSPTC